MPNDYKGWNAKGKFYKKGRKKEYKIVHRLRDMGFIAFRSAGSHSPVDVVGIDIANTRIQLIQAKPDSMSDRARKRLEAQHKDLNGTFEVEFKVI